MLREAVKPRRDTLPHLPFFSLIFINNNTNPKLNCTWHFFPVFLKTFVPSVLRSGGFVASSFRDERGHEWRSSCKLSDILFDFK
jgi:hypothetical protein